MTCDRNCSQCIYGYRQVKKYKCGNKNDWMLQSIKYGTKSLNARLSSLMELEDKVVESYPRFGKFMHTAYQALLTEYKLWEVIA